MAEPEKIVYFHYDFRDVSFKFAPKWRTEDFRENTILRYMEMVGKKIGMTDDFYIYIPGTFQEFSDIMMLCGGGSLKNKAVRHILSSDRMYSPKRVSCFDKRYDWVENLLRIERGGEAHLSRGFEGWISNVRHIKYGE